MAPGALLVDVCDPTIPNDQVVGTLLEGQVGCLHVSQDGRATFCDGLIGWVFCKKIIHHL